MTEKNGFLPFKISKSARKRGDLVDRPSNINVDGGLLSDFDRL